MLQITPVSGSPGGECYLITSERSAVLLDAGFAFCARRTARNIQAVLGDRPLDYILLSHSHYDHMAGSPAIRAVYPMAEVVAGIHAQKIVARKNARDTMRALDAAAARTAGWEPDSAAVEELRVDRTVTDGDRIRTADWTIRAMETPGHTRCSISYYFEEEDLLAASESSGVDGGDRGVLTAFIIGYRMSLDAIDRCEAVGAARLLIPHSGLLTGDAAATFFSRSRAAAEKTADFILRCHRQGMDDEAIVRAYTAACFTPERARLQPREAFLLNARAMIPRLIREWEGSGREAG